MDQLALPHGGRGLRPLQLEGAARAAELQRAHKLRPLRITSREKGDIVMLGIGGFTPLSGFMTNADWRRVCDEMRTADGVFWPIPITLSVDDAIADAIAIGEEVALVDPDDDGVLAVISVTEKYRIDKAHECRSVFKTTDANHPGVRTIMQQGEVNLAGPVRVLSDGGFKAKTARCSRRRRRLAPNSNGWGGRVSRHFRRETRCIARTNTLSRSRSRFAMAC